MVNIVFIAGGTGGHLFPAISTIIKMQQMGHNTHLITDQRCVRYLINYPSIQYSNYYSIAFIDGIFKKLFALLLITISTIKALFFYLKFKPQKVVIFGGYTTLSGALAAKLLNIELIIHEQNIVLGRANNLFLKYASKIATTFEGTLKIDAKYKSLVFLVGNPSKQDALSLVPINSYIKEQKVFNILVVGGSQGASIFGKIMPNILSKLIQDNREIKFKITQQARKEDIKLLSKLYEDMSIEYNVQEFYVDVIDRYLAADLIISRAGSGSIMDLIHASNVGILVPLPSSADNHQLKQAEYLSNQKAAICIEQNLQLEENCINSIQTLLKNTELMESYQKNITQFKKDATSNLANLILS